MRAAFAVLVVVAACHGGSAHGPEAHASAPLTSNVLRGDYAGSEACADCHGAIYDAWSRSPMRNMTRDAATAHIEAPFDGATLKVGTDTITMEQEGGDRFMRIASPEGDSRWRVTKVVGGRYREDFVGVDTASTSGIEHVLPATFVFSNHGWRYKGYSVMVKERPHSSVAGVWSQECVACHNVMPAATLLYDDIYGDKLPSYQGKLSDRTLPAGKKWPARARDEEKLARALDDEIRFLGGDLPAGKDSLDAVLPQAARVTNEKLDGAHLVELGVGCEACHNGSKQHAADPNVKPSFALVSDALEVSPPKGQEGTKTQWINHTCAKCHTVLFTKYPYTWEDKQRRTKDPGGSSTTSGEGRDFQLGGCASQMSCTTCHDPHTMDSRQKLDEMATKAGDKICARCHSKTPEHSHHKTVGCISCHMPKKNMGLDYVMDRYHRIASPTETAKVEGDAPLECALCHADKSVEALVSQMETWWGKKYDRDKLRKLYAGDRANNALISTVLYGKPHEQAAAMSALGDAKSTRAVEWIMKMMTHDYPLVRYFAKRALQNITGDPVNIDVEAPVDQIRTQVREWRASLGALHGGGQPGP